VVSTTPANAATGVVVSGLLPTITFSEAMNPFTFDATEGGGAPVDTITITPEDGGTTPEISGIVFSVGNTVASIFTDSAFSAGKRYKLRVSTAAHDANGNPLAVAYAQATGFTTAP
jgi:hypothetical protein